MQLLCLDAVALSTLHFVCHFSNYDTFCVLKVDLLGFGTGKDKRADSLEIVLDYLLADIIAERAIAIRVAAKTCNGAYAAKVQLSAPIL